MAHKKCLKKMREHIYCDCINDDLDDLKRLRKLISTYMIKDACMKLAKNRKAIQKLVRQIYGGKK